MDKLKERLRLLGCTVFADRQFTHSLAGGYYWAVSVTRDKYTHWVGSFVTKREAERFLRHVIEEVRLERAFSTL